MTSDSTPRLGLPWLMPAQAQKHVTVNEALGRLDALVQAVAHSRSLAVQPAAPDEGEAYILPAGATGADWDGFFEHDLAYFQDGAWFRVAPRAGLTAFVIDDGELVFCTGSSWSAYSSVIGRLADLTELGVGTAPDAANPFAVKVNSALWTALEAGAGGSGDLRFTLNKEAAGDTVSLLFQSAWSGRAELGLAGAEDFAIKLSADGTSWIEALSFDRTSGAARFGAGAVTIKADTLNLASLPVSPTGLVAGDLWNDAGTVKIVV